MNIKLLAVDLDGTLLKTDKTLSDRTKHALRCALERDILIVPTTGRVKKTVPQNVLNLQGIRYLITSNGASVQDLRDGKILYHNLMSMEETNRILQAVSDYGLLVEAYCDGKSYSESNAFQQMKEYELPQPFYDYIGKTQIFVNNLPKYIKEKNHPLEKINIPFVPEYLRENLIDRLSQMPEFSLSASSSSNVEINSATAGKGDALRYLCTQLGISPLQVMAVGDSSNDISMLEYAFFSVVMGNAKEPIKRCADYVTKSNEEDGVACAIEKYLLG